jgi:hypothetical protein
MISLADRRCTRPAHSSDVTHTWMRFLIMPSDEKRWPRSPRPPVDRCRFARGPLAASEATRGPKASYYGETSLKIPPFKVAPSPLPAMIP